MRHGLSNRKWLLAKKDPQTGHIRTVVYTGSLRTKPKGWKVLKEIF